MLTGNINASSYSYITDDSCQSVFNYPHDAYEISEWEYLAQFILNHSKQKNRNRVIKLFVSYPWLSPGVDTFRPRVILSKHISEKTAKLIRWHRFSFYLSPIQPNTFIKIGTKHESPILFLSYIMGKLRHTFCDMIALSLALITKGQIHLQNSVALDFYCNLAIINGSLNENIQSFSCCHEMFSATDFYH